MAMGSPETPHEAEGMPNYFTLLMFKTALKTNTHAETVQTND